MKQETIDEIWKLHKEGVAVNHAIERIKSNDDIVLYASKHTYTWLQASHDGPLIVADGGMKVAILEYLQSKNVSIALQIKKIVNETEAEQ